ncbi:RagB/SusD domain-containing protein [Candidatus Symbiothrix dinenymphae]|nr:RagB/SusD domain-containing protein [Candidatus Symbiothrix dinenymphae]
MKKNIYKNRRDVARHVCTFTVAAMCIFPSCSDFLDVVPDKSMTLESVFVTKEEAYNALAKAYSYLPHEEWRQSSWLLGDEWVQPQHLDGQDNNGNQYKAIWIMRGGRQSATASLLGRWRTGPPSAEGSNSVGPPQAPNLYEGINTCNLFISRVDGINDMEAEEIADWKAQVTFLKAYYHFLLLQQYGPIIIMDELTSPDAEPSKLYYSRSKIDKCFNYITATMKAAIQNLQLQKEGADLGQVTKVAAQSILAKVLVWRASPFYSGNDDYRNFNDWDGQPFFPQDDAATTKNKWKEAEEAVDAAIALCPSSGVELYHYDNKRMLLEDIPDLRKNPRIQTLYDLRWVITDPWNKELIWGNSNSRVILDNDYYLLGDAQIRQNTPIAHQNVEMLSHNFLGATYKTLERFYTKNGLPLDDDNDPSFDPARRGDHPVNTPDTTGGNYAYLGFLQSNFPTVQLNLNREPRFYANLGITGGYWRSYGTRISTSMYSGQNGAYGGNNRFWSGIGVQKIVHPNSKNQAWGQIANYPTPIIRMADLYLMKAEARLQYLGAPDPDVYAAINEVRTRAGIPTVQVAYTTYAKSSVSTNYQTKDGLLDIILNERGNEFAFEGHRFWDMLRYKRAVTEFSIPVTGWNYNGGDAASFFQQSLLQERLFTLRDCLWPIPTLELTKNVKLKQNPGW